MMSFRAVFDAANPASDDRGVVTDVVPADGDE
ncbi:hypothetical protein SAMN05216559_1649 [Halomicrobium zhouii]|uniref:Uncharacterized protein n=1 Tax=Halomicrobium zhouii TaxID=767519 RepID=A0A1I6KZD0_9EURY|nr:hypothetical protein SAMN05216559_1649 [Halomicrobium zhouii]